MKAIQYVDYGDTGVIKLNDVDKPVPQDDELLVRINVTSINPMDIKIRSGSMKDRMPIHFPYTPGLDFAGIVEGAGNKTHRIKVGDEVFGVNFGGTYAQYFVVKENQVSTVPRNTNLKEAAALSVPLVTAYSFLVETAALMEGQKVLIHAAAGGTGMIMVQMAKALGAYVIGTASGRGLDILKAYHVDEIIDHKRQDFSKMLKDVDVVIDLVGGETQVKSFQIVKSGGLLLSAVMPPSPELAKQYNVIAKFISSQPNHIKLDYGKAMVEQGLITARVIKEFPLEDAGQAQDLLAKGGLNGKIVLFVD